MLSAEDSAFLGLQLVVGADDRARTMAGDMSPPFCLDVKGTPGDCLWYKLVCQHSCHRATVNEPRADEPLATQSLSLPRSPGPLSRGECLVFAVGLLKIAVGSDEGRVHFSARSFFCVRHILSSVVGAFWTHVRVSGNSWVFSARRYAHGDGLGSTGCLFGLGYPFLTR